jgi:LacI family transcriptional regulator
MIYLRRVTIKDISRELNVSLNTINKAITGKPGISEETRKLVLETADKMGYKVNKLAQSLARNPITIGIVFPNVWPEYYSSMENGITKSLNALSDYNINAEIRKVPNLFSKKELIKVLNSFANENIDAVVTCPIFEGGYEEGLNKLINRKIPVVLMGSDLLNVQRLTCIRANAFLAGELAAEYMRWLLVPQRSVAVFIGNKDLTDHKEKVEGFRREVNRFPYKINGVYETQDDPEVAYHITKKLIEEGSDLGGIYVATGNSVSVCKCVQDLGKKTEIKIVATDIFPELKQYIDDNTIQGLIFQNPQMQGRLAVETIYRYIAENKSCEREIFVNPQLVLRSNFQSYLDRILASEN